jgi:hypothetical protein
MALLNPPQILPSVARVLFRALQASDDFKMTRDDLAKAVAPAALPRSENAQEGPGSKAFDDTLGACLTIRLFERDGDMIGIAADLPEIARDRRRRDQQLRSIIRELVLSDAVNHGLWDSTEGARDLTRALAWFAAQSPLRPPGPWNEPDGVDVAQERQFAGAERVFSNDTRWGAFERWATFLGFAQHLPRGNKDVLVPDPTPVLREVVPELLTRERQELPAVVEQVARHVPVLDGGTYRRDVEARMKADNVSTAPDLLSPSLSHALLRLRDERVIALEDLADAPVKIRLASGFGPERTITHASLPQQRRAAR